MNKVIFLDHDGVICLATEWGSRFDNKEGLDSHFDRFNKGAVDVLNAIIEATDCEIVVSSDWRHHADLETLQELYRIRGIVKGPIGMTDYVPTVASQLENARILEIKNYLEAHPEIESWVAVDDMQLGKVVESKEYGMFGKPHGLDNFVWTPRSSEGIKQTGVKEKIIKYLNGGTNKEAQ